MKNTVSCLIPFSGFYGTWHDSEFDDVLERMFDPEGNGAKFASPLAMRFWGTINWQAAQTAYAADYVERFAAALGFSACEFEQMVSPREYNFSTDRLFAKLPESEIVALFVKPDIRAELDTVAAEWFTSRSGFISSYSPDVQDWGDLAEWDYNQRGALLQAAANIDIADGGAFGQSEEFDLMESARCNGAIEDYMWGNTTDGAAMGNRCDRVARYLSQRQGF